jgi:hypothetical protein
MVWLLRRQPQAEAVCSGISLSRPPIFRTEFPQIAAGRTRMVRNQVFAIAFFRAAGAQGVKEPRCPSRFELRSGPDWRWPVFSR